MAKPEQGNGLEMQDSNEKLTDNGNGSMFGTDQEVNGNAIQVEAQVDKYGFTGGAQQSSREIVEEIPTDVLRQRESKWLEMLNNWDKWMAKKHRKVKERCQKGIPPSLRGRAWLYLTGGKVRREQNQGHFQELDDQPGDPKWIDIIERDLHRQFPFHEMFAARGGHGQQDLLRVLKAYTLHRPEEGYCQAQAPIAAVLLMHMPAEDAFWVLVQICEKYLPGYYSTGLEAIQLDGEILYALLRRVSPVAHRHLKKHKLEPILYMTEWFMCAFSRTLPWATVLRVWDMFLCEGVKIVFRVGLVLLKSMLGSQEKLKTCQGLYETMEMLRSIQPQYMHEGYLVHEVIELEVSEKDIEKEHHAQLKRWKESRGDLHCTSPPRMHGAKAIMTADPPSRQDLRQRPTIIVESPLASQTDSARVEGTTDTRKSKEEKEKKTILPSPETVNPYLPPGDPSPLLNHVTAAQGSKESLSSAEHDTYL
ncbi:TBC1 domain family member 10A [Notolabrus celidotus]|uniref:TBC1 domain family member 10A n=1 Tax=Notolabrus celidotus TaxID=1203425 RepID=UPI00148FF0B1|nr:TBC1 domain family member 10A [Notolabrus celidotus]XP_034566263.1 TBC1 domain family member 10A [Notolabrus celidotus]XP_034566264.1 TBC1 domain family member 10A [Notolabrus celidotus]XP_034566265.1 TBC1 domain family member 10A [Notolabrus celidotus]XP_034566267.1 TBC1 domain family member 10A [Notolabrus celidotus]